MASTAKKGPPELSARVYHSPPTLPDFNDLSSEPFKILAESGKCFFIHSDILAAQSEPLRSAVAGVWKEATEKRIDLSDWDSDTVGRFIEFLYFGRYQAPMLVLEEVGPGMADTSEPDRKAVKEMSANVFLVQAKVYALAQYKAVEKLKAMALRGLRTALEGIDGRTFTEASTVVVTANIVELLEYVYSHTDSPTNSTEPMRDLVSNFIAKNFEVFIGRGEVRSFLSERGDLGVELMEKVANRLADAGGASKVKKELQEWKGRAAALEKKVQDLQERLDGYES